MVKRPRSASRLRQTRNHGWILRAAAWLSYVRPSLATRRRTATERQARARVRDATYFSCVRPRRAMSLRAANARRARVIVAACRARTTIVIRIHVRMQAAARHLMRCGVSKETRMRSSWGSMTMRSPREEVAVGALKGARWGA